MYIFTRPRQRGRATYLYKPGRSGQASSRLSPLTALTYPGEELEPDCVGDRPDQFRVFEHRVNRVPSKPSPRTEKPSKETTRAKTESLSLNRAYRPIEPSLYLSVRIPRWCAQPLRLKLQFQPSQTEIFRKKDKKLQLHLFVLYYTCD
jgi:hypothetical protein